MTEETANDLAEAFREHRDAFGVPITLAGQDVTAVVSESMLSRELAATGGGFHPDAEFQVKVLLSDLTTLLALGNRVTYKGQTWKIAKVGIQPGGLVGEYLIRPQGR